VRLRKLWLAATVVVAGLTGALGGAVYANTQPIDGVYRISTKAQPDLCLQVPGFNNSDGASIDMDVAGVSSNQQWMVQSQGDGTYKIYAYSGQNSIQMLDSNYGAYQAVVHTWEDLDLDGVADTNQRWYFVHVTGPYYKIVPEENGVAGTEVLDVGEGDPGGEPGETTDIWTYYGSGNQLFKLEWGGPTQVLPNPKKGVASEDPYAAGLNCSWVYDWAGTLPTDVPTGMEFVPMEWNWAPGSPPAPYQADTWTQYYQAICPGMQHVLGYNEPDGQLDNGGSNMTVASALQGFQYISDLSAAGVSIVSPACAADNDSWMESFMSQATVSPFDYIINSVGFHNYPSDSTGTAAADDILGYIDYIHTLYGLPMWITEFAPSGVDIDNADAMTFIRLVCQGLNSRSYVQRYALFTVMAPTATGFGSSALINTNGTYTDCGQVYARM
jgi:hypothetical protein